MTDGSWDRSSTTRDGGVYFGVPLSNFAGWMILGAAGVGGYLLWSRGTDRHSGRPALVGTVSVAAAGGGGAPVGGRGTDRSPAAAHGGEAGPLTGWGATSFDRYGRRVWPGIALYYAVLGFNLVGDRLDRGVAVANGRRRVARGDRSRFSQPGSETRRPVGSGEAARMSVPVSQMWTVATYVLGQKLRATQALPAGPHARAALPVQPRLRRAAARSSTPRISSRSTSRVEQCLAAVEECGAPMVSIPGGEPLMYPEIGRARARAGGPPQVRLPVHERHPPQAEARARGCSSRRSTCRSASTWTGCATSTTRRCAATASSTRRVEGIREALSRGFRVTTNTTLFDGANAAAHARSSSTR